MNTFEYNNPELNSKPEYPSYKAIGCQHLFEELVNIKDAENYPPLTIKKDGGKYIISILIKGLNHNDILIYKDNEKNYNNINVRYINNRTISPYLEQFYDKNINNDKTIQFSNLAKRSFIKNFILGENIQCNDVYIKNDELIIELIESEDIEIFKYYLIRDFDNPNVDKDNSYIILENKHTVG